MDRSSMSPNPQTKNKNKQTKTSRVKQLFGYLDEYIIWKIQFINKCPYLHSFTDISFHLKKSFMPTQFSEVKCLAKADRGPL